MQASEVKMQASEAPDFWGLHKNMNTLRFPLRLSSVFLRRIGTSRSSQLKPVTLFNRDARAGVFL